MKSNIQIAFFCVVLLAVGTLGCGGGGGSGACVSSGADRFPNNEPYCFNNFDSSDCEEFDREEINGADRWIFYSGQTCSDRGLDADN
jgi:hypothetical protein